MQDLSDRPILSYDEQIENLKGKGITFNLGFSEDEAKEYLRSHNNFFRVRSYRENFKDRNPNNKSQKYNELDFAHLVDLSRIDVRLRRIILNMSVDIEHYSKLKLLNSIIESSKIDTDKNSHKFVNEFINKALNSGERNFFMKQIERNAQNIYLHGLYNKYKNGFPIWAFFEVISFGQFTQFYKFYIDNYDNEFGNRDFYLLDKVRRARNAAAHNNCFINDLRSVKEPLGNGKERCNKDEEVMTALAKVGVKKSRRKKKMSNERVVQIITCLYAYQKIVTHREHPEIYSRTSHELHSFSNRLFEKFRYESNDIIRTTFDMIKTVIDHWYTIK